MPGEKLCKVLLLFTETQPRQTPFAPRPFIFFSYTIPPLRHFLRVRRPSAKKALQSGAKACIINASNMLTERVRARFRPPAEGRRRLQAPGDGFAPKFTHEWLLLKVAAGRQRRVFPLQNNRVFALVQSYGKNVGGTAEFTNR